MPGLIEQGRLEEWPPYPEFTRPDANLKDAEELLSYKRGIVTRFGEDAIRQSWLKVCKELESVTKSISANGTNGIPVLSYKEFSTLSDENQATLKSFGAFVIRGVIPRDEAEQHFRNLKTYVADNKDKVTGWPPESPAILDLSWSPTQISLRTHPSQLHVQRLLNSWWKDRSGTTSPEPLLYSDAVRIRPAGVPLLGLGPHIDAGNLSRWADPSYINVYSSIFSGFPEEHDPYDLERRKDANQALFNEGVHQSTVFRAFQGWTALTRAGPREGSLLLYPNVSTVLAYLLLRPFFREPDEANDIMDASTWTFDINQSWFPGSSKSGSQMLSPTSHPHLRLKECMTRIPHMYPGDTIWWHCDMVHAVEVEHSGAEDASVAYIAATPTTPTNRRYIKQQLRDFLAGRPLEDFKRGADERKFKGFMGADGITNIEAGRAAMGFGL